MTPRPESTDDRMLRPERSGAPEPVGVPAPQVVRDGEPVASRAVAVLNRAVVDALTGVVADGAGFGGLRPHAQIALVGAEDHPVEIVDGHPIEVAGRDHAIHRRDQMRHRVEPEVRQGDERLDGFELDAQPDGIAQRSVGVGKRAVEVVVLMRRHGENLARAGQDVHLDNGLVRQPAAKGRRLDSEARDSAAQGDRLELWHYERCQAVGERRRDEVFVGAHAGDVGCSALGIDRDHARQPGSVETLGVGLGAPSEQVGGALGEPNGSVSRDRPVAREKALHADGVSGACVGRRCGHAPTLVRGAFQVKGAVQ